MPADPTAADRAHEAALQKIESVRAAAGTHLDFGSPQFRALARIPDSLRTLPGLTRLTLNGTAVTDLLPLQGLAGLQVLSLYTTGVADLTPLHGLTGLRTLWLTRTEVADLTPLQSLTGLQRLSFGQTPVTDLAPLQHLTGLQWLASGETGVTDLTPLQGLTGLRTLLLALTAVTDLVPLQGLTGLRNLSLDQTAVADLTPLQHLTGLQTLSLEGTAVNDLSPLQGLTGLQGLSLEGSAVDDLRPIRDLPGLAHKDPDGPDFTGLFFSDTPAVRRDQQLARLDEIRDVADRTAQTQVYLRSLPPWPEPLPWPLANVLPEDGLPPLPVSDPMPMMVLTDEKLDLGHSPAGPGDPADAVRAGLQARLPATVGEGERRVAEGLAKADLATVRLRRVAGQLAHAGDTGSVAAYRRAFNRNAVIAIAYVATGIGDSNVGIVYGAAILPAAQFLLLHKDAIMATAPGWGEGGVRWLEYILIRAGQVVRNAQHGRDA